MEQLLNNKELIFLNQLLARLYESNNYEKAFTIFMEELRELVEFQKGDIYFYKDNHEHITFEDFIFTGWDEEYLSRYLHSYADLDDALPITSLKQPIMFRSSDIFLKDERMKTKYYNELLLPAGMEHSIEGNIYHDEEGYIAGIGIHRPNEFGDFTQRELEILKLCRPHLSNIARNYLDSRQSIESYTATLASVYDSGDIGLCVLDRNFEVIDSNLNKNQFINQEHIGEMMRSVITLAKSLSAEMINGKRRNAAADLKAQSRITIGNVAYYAEVICKPTSVIDYKFIATIYNFNKVFDMMFYDIMARYNLTEREREILILAMKGMNNTDIGKQLFISVATVKKHLTNVYMKMGISGKHQLFSKILE